MFGLALWDGRKRRLVLARDPFGIKPVYYMPLEGGRLAFASEIKCFLASAMLSPGVDPEALHYFLNFLWVPGPETLFKGIFKLRPGHVLLWQDHHYGIRQYWEGKPSAEVQERPEGDLVEELRALLRLAVKRHLISDVPLGVFLSGGVESSSLVALGTQISGRPMKAYTIAFRSDDADLEQSDEDPEFARLVAREFGAEHHEIEIQPDLADLLPRVIWHLDEPVADPATITSYLIAKAAREQVTVLLNGQGADEVFGGYRIHLADRLSFPLQFMPSFLREKVLSPMWDCLPSLRNSLPGVRPGKVLAFHRYFRKILRGAGYDGPERYLFHRSY